MLAGIWEEYLVGPQKPPELALGNAIRLVDVARIKPATRWLQRSGAMEMFGL
jgi:hypothetical protein